MSKNSSIAFQKWNNAFQNVPKSGYNNSVSRREAAFVENRQSVLNRENTYREAMLPFLFTQKQEGWTCQGNQKLLADILAVRDW